MAKVTVEIPDALLWSEVMGSAFETWGWWQVEYLDGAAWDKPGSVKMTLIDPDTDDVVAQKVVTVQDIADVLLAWEVSVISRVGVDAIGGDSILQRVVAGEVVFG